MGECKEMPTEDIEMAEAAPKPVIRASEIGRTTLNCTECHVWECAPVKGKFACGSEQALFLGCPDRVNRGAC